MYKELARVPQPIDAYACYQNDARTLHLTTTWQTIDTELEENVTFMRHHTSALDVQGPLAFQQVGHAQDIGNEYVNTPFESILSVWILFFRAMEKPSRVNAYLDIFSVECLWRRPCTRPKSGLVQLGLV